MKTIERLYYETNNKLYYETKVNGVTVTLYEGLDGDYHVTLADSEMEHTHEIFEDFDQANAFFDSIVEDEREKEIDSTNP